MPRRASGYHSLASFHKDDNRGQRAEHWPWIDGALPGRAKQDDPSWPAPDPRSKLLNMRDF
jgi:hypothetical protein